MSTSITSPQTLKTVASTLTFLANKDNKMSSEFASLQAVAAKTVGDILVNRDEEFDPNTSAISIYDALKALNHTSLHASYPKLDDMRHGKDHELTLADFTPEQDVSFDPSRPDKSLLFLNTAINSVRHGHYDTITNHNLTKNLKAMQVQLDRAVTITSIKRNGIMSPPPVESVAESMTRTFTNGDYLYGLQSGASIAFESLTTIADNSVQVWGNDVFMKLYTQSQQEGTTSLNLPINGHLGGPSVRELRTGDYQLSGDIPYPDQNDIDKINYAIEVLRYKINTLSLNDSKGKALDDIDTKSARKAFNKFADTHLSLSNSVRVSEYYNVIHKPFAQAQADVDATYLQRHDYNLLIDGDIPSPENEVRPNLSIPEEIRRINSMQSVSGNKLMIMKGNDFDDLVDVQSRFPKTVIIPILLSDRERAHIDQETVSPAQFVIRNISHKLYDAYRGEDDKLTCSAEEFGNTLAVAISHLLPGVDETIQDNIKETVNNCEMYWNPSFIARRVEEDLPGYAKAALKDSEGIVPLNKHNEPSKPTSEKTTHQDAITSPELSGRRNRN